MVAVWTQEDHHEMKPVCSSSSWLHDGGPGRECLLGGVCVLLESVSPALGSRHQDNNEDKH